MPAIITTAGPITASYVTVGLCYSACTVELPWPLLQCMYSWITLAFVTALSSLLLALLLLWTPAIITSTGPITASYVTAVLVDASLVISSAGPFCQPSLAGPLLVILNIVNIIYCIKLGVISQVWSPNYVVTCSNLLSNILRNYVLLIYEYIYLLRFYCLYPLIWQKLNCK